MQDLLDQRDDARSKAEQFQRKYDGLDRSDWPADALARIDYTAHARLEPHAGNQIADLKDAELDRAAGALRDLQMARLKKLSAVLKLCIILTFLSLIVAVVANIRLSTETKPLRESGAT